MTFSPVPHIGEIGIVPPEGFDSEKARAALEKQLDELRKHRDRKAQLGQSPEFRAKASPETVNTIANELIEYAHREGLLIAQIRLLKPGS